MFITVVKKKHKGRNKVITYKILLPFTPFGRYYIHSFDEKESRLFSCWTNIVLDEMEFERTFILNENDDYLSIRHKIKDELKGEK